MEIKYAIERDKNKNKLHIIITFNKIYFCYVSFISRAALSPIGLARFSGCGLQDRTRGYRDSRDRAESQVKNDYFFRKTGRAGRPECPPLV